MSLEEPAGIYILATIFLFPPLKLRFVPLDESNNESVPTFQGKQFAAELAFVGIRADK